MCTQRLVDALQTLYPFIQMYTCKKAYLSKKRKEVKKKRYPLINTKFSNVLLADLDLFLK